MQNLRIEKLKNLSLAALLMAGAAFAACTSSSDSIIEEQPAEPTAPKTCTLTVNATKGGDATTRALALDESGEKNELNATWTAGDKVAVYYMHPKDMGGEIMYTPTQIGTLEAQSSGASTTLTGDITTTGITIGGMFGDPSETHDLTTDDKLYLSYSGTLGEGLQAFSQQQDGSLQTLANYFDYAGADVTVSGVSGSTVSINEASAQFENLSYIIRFTLQDKATGNVISPSSLSFECQTTGEYPVVGTTNIDILDATYTANGAGVVFVQLPRTNQTTGFTGDITLTATVGDKTYTYTKSGVNFTNGKYYEITVKMTKVPTLADVFTDGAVVDVKFNTANDEWLSVTGTYNAGTSTFATTKSGSYEPESVSMTKDGNNLVASVTKFNTITVTFNTTTNEYTLSVTSANTPWIMISLNSITVNGTNITSTLTDVTPTPSSLSVTVTDSSGSGVGNQTIYYTKGNTWGDAIDKYSENAGWEYGFDDEIGEYSVRYNGHRVYLWGNLIDQDQTINPYFHYEFHD